MKSLLPRLGLLVAFFTILLVHQGIFASSSDEKDVVVIPKIDQIPYYILGEASHEYFAKPIGKWIAQKQFGMNSTTQPVMTSIVQQDAKFFFAGLMQAFLSVVLPSLGKSMKPQGENVGRLAPIAESDSLRDAMISPSVSPAPYPLGTLRSGLSAGTLSDLTQNVKAQGKGPVILAAEEAEAAVFKAGTKYIAVTEFFEYAMRMCHELEAVINVRNQQNVVFRNTTGITQVNDKLQPSEMFFVPQAIINHAYGVGSFVRNLYEHKGLISYANAAFLTAAFLTRVSMQISRTGRVKNFVNQGLPFLNTEFGKQVFETTVGVLMSQWAKTDEIKPFLKNLAIKAGINVNGTESLVEIAYQAGIKGTFAYDAAFAETFKKGAISIGMFLTYAAMDYLMPWINDEIAGMRETVCEGLLAMAIVYASVRLMYPPKNANVQAVHVHAS